jgi:uncharacterized protein (TIGR02145 family)
MKISILITTFALLFVTILFESGCQKEKENILPANTVTDVDGNIYKTVTIGSQVWMAENLKVTHYQNGELIISSKGLSWQNTEEGAYCALNDHSGNIERFGLLYNGFAVMDTRKIAPKGWHIPSVAEWLSLIDYLGGQMVAGGKLKDTTISWIKPNIGATNESGFSALPGGYRTFNIEYKEAYVSGYWWSSTEPEQDSGSIYFLYLHNSNTYTGGMTSWYYKQAGFSVRCVRD